jgi:hypothetical protein
VTIGLSFRLASLLATGSPVMEVVVSLALVFSGMYDTEKETPQCLSNW